MQRMALLMISLVCMLFAACDTTDQLNKPRTMIIGGVPVYEQDYKLPRADTEHSTLGE